jgi:adenosylhomocysteine nucleosidase
MDSEVEYLISLLSEKEIVNVGGIDFHYGKMHERKVVIARCGIGKVFAAMCAQAMIITFAPHIIINTGVGGALKKGIAIADIVVGERLVQHDMDTSPIGDPKGLISGINKIFFEGDRNGIELLSRLGEELSLPVKVGAIASGDKFVADKETKSFIVSEFGCDVCEMEGASIAQVAYVNKTPFIVIRAVSDSADEGSSMDYHEFLPIAADRSARLTLAFVKNYVKD